MLMKVLKGAGDSRKPDEVDMDTTLFVGSKFKMEYDWCTRIPCIGGYRLDWHKDIAKFEVVDIVCNMLIYPVEVWVRLNSNDEEFIKRCGSSEFDAPEKQILERKIA